MYQYLKTIGKYKEVFSQTSNIYEALFTFEEKYCYDIDFLEIQ